MKAYKIERWDAILPRDSSNSLPMIYISADSDLLKFAQKNNYKFLVEIRGTNSIYDRKRMKGVFDALLLGPNCKSESVKNKNWYTISLDSYFYSYPPLLGEVVVPDLVPSINPVVKDIIRTTPEIVSAARAAARPPENVFAYSEEPKNGFAGMSTPMIFVTLGLIALAVLAIFLINRGRKN